MERTMNKVIYYFSGSGNNIAVAKGLCENIPDMEMYPITDLLENKVINEKYDLVGFTVPSYYSHIPPIVADCIKNLKFSNNQKVFSIIGCAGNRGHATEDIRHLVKACEKEVDYEYMIIFAGNYILSYNAFPKWYQNLVLKFSKKKMKKISKQLLEAKRAKPLGKGLFYSAKYEEALQKSIRKYSQTGLEYTVSNECSKCSQCIQICLVNNITMESGQIKFGSNCQQCMACIQWCPNKAIDYKGIAKDRIRYHHPDILVRDMID